MPKELTYEQMIIQNEKSKNGIDIAIGRVPDSTYFFIDLQENILGVVNIRHELNEAIKQTGGHIGYGISPHYRGQGLGKIMLGLALDQCRKLGIDQVLVTCGKQNIQSAKTILLCGGILENEVFTFEHGLIQRYWIDNTRQER